MFKTLMGLAMAVPALAIEGVKDDLAEMQCQAMTTDSGTVFSVTGIEHPEHYIVNVKDDGVSGKSLIFNYCTYVDSSSGVYGIYRTLADPSKDVVVANERVKALSAKNMREDPNDDTSKTKGIIFTQSSDTKCATDSSQTYSMRTELTCEEDSAPKVDKVRLDGCDFVVEMRADEGCPTVPIDVD